MVKTYKLVHIKTADAEQFKFKLEGRFISISERDRLSLA